MKKQILILFFAIIAFNNYYFSQSTVPTNTRLFQPTLSQGTFVKAYARHLNSAKDELFYTILANADNTDYFGETVMKGTRLISRLSKEGLPVWSAKFIGDVNAKNSNLNYATKYMANVDKDDNLYILTSVQNATKYIDASGQITNIPYSSYLNLQKVLLKISKDGILLWYKIILSTGDNSITTDNLGNVFVLGGVGYKIDNFSLENGASIVKLNPNNGNVLYAKNLTNLNNILTIYQMIPAFDNQNNLYLFLEPIISDQNKPYIFDGISVPTNLYNLDSLMLKLDSNGNVVFGKNFYGNSNILSYNWANDVVFDGTDFILIGNIYSSKSLDFYLGLDGTQITKNYPLYNYAGLLTKIKIDGTVSWQKIIESYVLGGFYTNIDLDEYKNIYGNFYFYDKIKYDGTEYTFDAVYGNKVLSKFDTNGNLKYFNSVDTYYDRFNSGTNYSDYYNIIDVLGEDKLNCTGFTKQNYFKNYNLLNSITPKAYIATFGNLDNKYLTAINNYLKINNIEISNNPGNNNQFTFNLINNVNWMATSDSSWLSLNSTQLTGKITHTSKSISVSGKGDSSISLTASTNNTGATRVANVNITGDNSVPSINIVVTQSISAGTKESQTNLFVLYPNPTTDILNIQTNQKITTIKVYDSTGKLIKITKGTDKKIDVSGLEKGTYLISLETENGIVNSKFIKK